MLSISHIIIDTVCNHYKIDRVQFWSQSRKSKYVQARYVTAWMFKSLFPEMNFDEIGKIINRDRTTAYSGIQKVEKKLSYQHHLTNQAELILKLFLDVISRQGKIFKK